MEFSHPYFQRDHPYLLEHIKRKISTAKNANVDDKSTIKHEVVSKVLTDVKLMKGRQDSLDNRFLSMKQENEALWREVAILRQKHMKQQQIVNKLIQFLVTIVQPQRGSGIGSMGGMSGVKRRFQLMINDVPDAAKQRKTTRQSSASSNNDGPIIHELTEELLDDYADQDDDVNSPYVVSPGFQAASVHEYDDIESGNNADVEQIVTEDEIVGAAPSPAVNIYNTTDYSADPIYDKNSKQRMVQSIVDAGSSNDIVADDFTDIPVEELLENVVEAVEPITTTTSSSFIPAVQQKTPVLIQTQQIIKPSTNQKTMETKKTAMNIPITNIVGAKRLPISKVIGSLPNKQQPVTAYHANTTTTATAATSANTGKSLLDAQKLRAAKMQQFQLQQQASKKFQQNQPNENQLKNNIITTIPITTPQTGNKPILITVGRPQAATDTEQSQQSASSAAAKTYKNKDDFISSEIPNELFEGDESNQVSIV